METSSTLKISYPATYVIEVTLNRLEKLNSITFPMFMELEKVFNKIALDPEIRVVIISGHEKVFSSGGDIYDLVDGFPYESDDFARKTIYMKKMFKASSRFIKAMDTCGKPIISAVSGICIGSGLEFSLASDIRYCTKSLKACLKEVNNGIVSWMGGIQRMQKLIGWNSWIREILFTGRWFTAEEALKVGLFSRVFDTYKEMMDYTLETAILLASKSPVAVYGTKVNLNFSRDHSLFDNFDYGSGWNGWYYHNQDKMIAISSQLQKSEAVYPKL